MLEVGTLSVENKTKFRDYRDRNFEHQCLHRSHDFLHPHAASLDYAPTSAPEIPAHRDILLRLHSRHHLDSSHPNAPARRLIPRPDVHQRPDRSVVARRARNPLHSSSSRKPARLMRRLASRHCHPPTWTGGHCERPSENNGRTNANAKSNRTNAKKGRFPAPWAQTLLNPSKTSF